MIRTVLVDDEPLGLALLRKYLEDTGKVDIVGQYTDPEQAVREIPTLAPDLVFLDVEMPVKNGISVGSELLESNDNLEIVFVTAYERYAIQAFNLNAIHYLLKPVHPDAIQETLMRMTKRRALPPKALPANVNLRLFGEIGFQKNGTPLKVGWITAKVEELFALLVGERASGISKWRIMDLLWQELEPQKAQQNLYTTVFRLKKALKEAQISAEIENDAGVYYLHLKQVVCDLDEFEALIHKKEPLEEWGPEEWKRLVDRYEGDLFGERAYSWSLWKRDLCYSRFLASLKYLLAWYAQEGDRAAAKLLLLGKGRHLHDEDSTDVNDIYRRLF